MTQIPDTIEALSIQEFKAICEFFFDEGYNRHQCLRTSPAGRKARGEKWADDFETTFNNLMVGKYAKMIEKDTLNIRWEEMQSGIQKAMDEWDETQRGKAAQVLEDMRKIFINT